MTTQSIILTIIGIILILSSIIFKTKRQPKSQYRHKPENPTPTTSSYLKTNLLTPNELSFYKTLKTIVEDKITIMTKVRLADIIKTENIDIIAFNQISQKHIDFTLCNPETLSPQCVIELDDNTHNRENRKQRDEFIDNTLKSAGIKIIHIRARQNYTSNEVKKELEKHFT